MLLKRAFPIIFILCLLLPSFVLSFDCIHIRNAFFAVINYYCVLGGLRPHLRHISGGFGKQKQMKHEIPFPKNGQIRRYAPCSTKQLTAINSATQNRQTCNN